MKMILRLVHIIEGAVSVGPIHASIDADRRLRHMQHHTAQHLLTQCIIQKSGFETVSANINGYSPSTLDLLTTQISKNNLDDAELLANQVIYEDRLVKTYIVSPEELQSIPLRRPPKVTENIRIVEIDGYDYSPCGGTHVQHTGSIGLVKVLKEERMNDKIRIHFIAGLQAMQVYRQMYGVLVGLANKMSTSWQDIPELVAKQAEQLSATQKELIAVHQASVKYEARELVEKSELQAGFHLVKASYKDRPMTELRMLGDQLKKVPGVIACLCSFDGQKVSLVVTAGEDTGKDARLLLQTQLAPIGGRGGGDARLAQGGGVATEEQYQSFPSANRLRVNLE